MQPRVTVLMPVYNAAPYVAEAAKSILSSGTREIELLAINDGSTDRSEAILMSLNDPRVRVVNNPSNMGVVSTLNRGLDLARGAYVARMDADDISLPNRLPLQLDFMDANPEVELCGTWITTFGAGPEVTIRHPLKHNDIRVQLFAYNPIAHPSVIFRMKSLNKNNLRYATEAEHAEDMDLWIRSADLLTIENLPVVTLRYRMHPDQVTKLHTPDQVRTLNMLRFRQLKRLVPDASEVEATLHLTIFDLARKLSHEELNRAKAWLERLDTANMDSGVYDALAFRNFLKERWLNAAYRCEKSGVNAWKVWRSSFLSNDSLRSGTSLLLKKALRL